MAAGTAKIYKPQSFVIRRLAALVVVAGLAAGCQTMTGRTVSQWADDRAITARVKTRLAAARPAHLTRIHVDTWGGVVYLTGVVEREDLRERVEAIVGAVPDVRQVVANLKVLPRGEDEMAAAARVAAHPLVGRVPGLVRIEGNAPGPFAAYDTKGRMVATVFTVAMRELAEIGFEQRAPAARPVDHVAIYPVAGIPDVPEPQYHLVLWHVTRAEESRLR